MKKSLIVYDKAMKGQYDTTTRFQCISSTFPHAYLAELLAPVARLTADVGAVATQLGMLDASRGAA
jgi:hypothetical protein